MSEAKAPKRQVKSKQRVADHGEVFTAEREVNAMLDLVKPETERMSVFDIYGNRSYIFFDGSDVSPLPDCWFIVAGKE